MLADVDVIWDIRLLARPAQQRFGVQSLRFGFEQVPGTRTHAHTHTKEHLSSLRGTCPQVFVLGYCGFGCCFKLWSCVVLILSFQTEAEESASLDRAQRHNHTFLNSSLE